MGHARVAAMNLSDTNLRKNATTAIQIMSLPYNRHKDLVALARARARVKNENNKWEQSTQADIDRLEKRARHLKDTPHPCSCHMCCNPRRSGWTRGAGKLTMQELKNLNWKKETES